MMGLGPVVSQGSLREGGRRSEQREDVRTEAKVEEGRRCRPRSWRKGREPRNTGTSRAGTGWAVNVPLEPPEGPSPADTWTSVQ